jgi:hypothetical protein
MKVDDDIPHSSLPDIKAISDAAALRHHLLSDTCLADRNSQLLPYAEALNLATLFLTSNLCCFLSLMTLNLSKSVKSRLLALRALFFAQAESFQVWSTLAASHCFLMAPVPAALAILGMTMWVRETCARGAE